MNITYTILRFEPLQREFIVSYKAEGVSEEIALNLPLPLKDGAFMQGDELDAFIRAFAPVGDFELEQVVCSLDPSGIQGLIPPPPPPTPEEMQTQMTAVIQDYLDSKARERNYDGILSLCSYATSQNPRFAAEGLAGVKWRDDIWAACYGILDEVMSGERPIPSVNDLLVALPVMEWPL